MISSKCQLIFGCGWLSNPVHTDKNFLCIYVKWWDESGPTKDIDYRII